MSNGYSQGATTPVPKVTVLTTKNRAANPAELTEMALSKILYISDGASDEAKAQAVAFQDKLKNVLFIYLTESAKAERRTIVTALKRAGQEETAKFIEAL